MAQKQREKFMIKSEVTEIIKEPFDVYLSNSHFASCSTIKKYKKSPLHKKCQVDSDTEATAFGRMYHEFVLERDEFDKKYFVLDDSKFVQEISATYKNPRGTALYQAWFMDELSKAPKGSSPITLGEFQIMDDMKRELLKHAFVRYLLKASEKEVSAYGIIDGVLTKGRFDMYLERKRWIADLKTLRDSSESGIKNYLKTFDGHLQPAIYTLLAEKHIGDGMPWKFFWIGQEKVYPYAVGIYKASPQMMAVGLHEGGLLLAEHKFCTENDYYEGYEAFVGNEFGIREIDFPAYAIKDYQFYDQQRKKQD